MIDAFLKVIGDDDEKRVYVNHDIQSMKILNLFFKLFLVRNFKFLRSKKGHRAY